jgi:hypothetical protein
MSHNTSYCLILENSWSPKVDEKGNIFYLEVAEKCKQLSLKEFRESSVDDVGYGTDNELKFDKKKFIKISKFKLYSVELCDLQREH